MAATQQHPDEVATRVMRRVQVSKMTRVLQDRLALANVKIQNGWENMSLDAIEPQVEERMRRKRPASSNDTISDTASTTSSHLRSSSRLSSSPLTAPIFSEESHQRSGSSNLNKRIRPADMMKFTSSGAATGRRNRVTARHVSWKKTQNLPQSSPIHHTKHARLPSNNLTHVSFVSEGSTIPDDDPPSPELSEEDDADLPVHSFSLNSSTRMINSSPPQTPPPDRRFRKTNAVSWSRTPKNGEEGADLLMFLAQSPSGADARAAKTIIQAPSTPPHRSTPLPSSHMTPGMGGGLLGFGPNTPGTTFNFADFVNVSPSPAQGQYSIRTPNAGRTPGTAREARRKLNFDNLMPPTSSPALTRGGRNDGLGMELGGELVSSQ